MARFYNSKKKAIVYKYIEDELEKNEEDYQNNIIDDLIYTKNKLFSNTLKKDTKFLKNIENNSVIMNDYEIY